MSSIFEIEKNLPKECCSFCTHLSLLGPDENYNYEIKCILLDDSPRDASKCIHFYPEHTLKDSISIDSLYLDFLDSCFRIPYEEYLKTIHWQLFKNYVLDIANNKCSVCGTSNNVDVRHINRKLGRETLDDVCVICSSCLSSFQDF